MFLRRGASSYIRQPEFKEMGVVAELWADEDTMKEIGGPVIFEQSKWKEWYERMVSPGDGRNFYCLIYDINDKPVGEVSFHRFDKETGSAEFNVKVKHGCRGKGHGKEAVLLMLNYYFNEFGGQEMIDPIAIGNKDGQKAMLSLGFEHIFSDDEVFMIKMNKDKYNNIVI